MRPVLAYVSHDQSNVCHSNSKPNRLPATSSTRAAAGTTSLPMPSPGINAILWRMSVSLAGKHTSARGGRRHAAPVRIAITCGTAAAARSRSSAAVRLPSGWATTAN